MTVRAGSLVQRDYVRSGSRYCSQSMLRRHFGLGRAAAADEIEVRWPSGTLDHRVAALVVAEGKPTR